TIAKSSDGLARWDKAQVVVQTIATGARTTIVTGGSDARYVQSGHVLYAASAEYAIAVSDRAGQQMRTLVPPGPYTHVRASRDGARIAVGSDDGRDANVWIYALDGTAAMRRLTLDGQSRFPIWS